MTESAAMRESAGLPEVTGLVKHGVKLPLPSPSPFDGFRDLFSVQIKARMLGMTRAVASRKTIDPTAEDLAEYARLRAMLDEIEASKFWVVDYESSYLEEPRPQEAIEYAESWEEFAARVNAADLPTRPEFPLSTAFARVAVPQPYPGIVFHHPAD